MTPAYLSYWLTIFLMVAGLYILIARGNLLKKLIGLAVFQTSVYLLYIAPGKLIGGTAPIAQSLNTRSSFSSPTRCGFWPSSALRSPSWSLWSAGMTASR